MQITAAVARATNPPLNIFAGTRISDAIADALSGKVVKAILRF